MVVGLLSTGREVCIGTLTVVDCQVVLPLTSYKSHLNWKQSRLQFEKVHQVADQVADQVLLLPEQRICKGKKRQPLNYFYAKSGSIISYHIQDSPS